MSILSKAFGDEFKPQSLDSRAADQRAVFEKNYLPYLDKLSEGQRAEALSGLDTARAITPGYNDLALSELNRTADTAGAVDQKMAGAQARGDIANLNQYGVDAGKALMASDQSVNPEFYANRALTGQKMMDALNAQSPDLSAGQRAEVERGAGRLNPYGSDNSAVDTANKASQFGSAHQAQVNNFTNAINGISQNLGNLKSGLSPVSLALGRDYKGGAANGAIAPVTRGDNTAFQVGQGFMNNINGQAGQIDQLKANAFRSYGDALNQDSSSFSNIAGGAAKLGA